MRKNKKSPIFRKGDRVIIKNPEFFIRCGYPLCLKDKLIEIENSKFHQDKIIELIRYFELYDNSFNQDFGVEYPIKKALALGLLRKDKFGGNERKIYTKQIPELKDKVFHAFGKRVVNTGIRIAGSTRSNWDGDPDYNPPYLDKQKSHVILEIWDQYCLYQGFDKFYNPKSDHISLFDIKKQYFDDPGFVLEIEESNVELYKEEK